MDIGASGGHQHACCEAGVHIFQVQLGGVRSAEEIIRKLHLRTHKITPGYSRLTYIWENLKRASKLMLRSNTFMVEAGEET